MVDILQSYNGRHSTEPAVDQQSCNGRGSAQRPVLGVNEPKRPGARSAQLRSVSQNSIVFHMLLFPYRLWMK